MSDTIRFWLDGQEVEANPGETIWQVAHREGVEIPHLCYSPEPGYRPDGNCRACMVEIEGERVLAPSCNRQPRPDMKVHVASDRAKKSRELVFELLVADQPARDIAHDPDSKFWHWADAVGVSESRFPSNGAVPDDMSHPAMAVQLDACILCGLCERACREVQVNDVIGISARGAEAKIIFDFEDPMGASTCVACGECVQACPTGALLPKSVIDDVGAVAVKADREVESVCPYCGVGCQITYHVADDKIIKVEGRDGPGNRGRLCVKGRFGFDYVHNDRRLTKPLIRRDDAPKDAALSGDLRAQFREATWEEALERAVSGLIHTRDTHGGRALAGFGSAKGSNEEAYLFQKLVRTGFGSNNVDHCTRLCHAASVAALMEGIGSGAVTAPFTAAEDAECIVIIGANPTENHPVAATFFKQAAKDGATLITMDPRGTHLSRHATHDLRFKPGTDVAMLNAILNVIVEEGLYDRQYVEAHTRDFDLIAQHSKGFTPEEMAPICGIEADTLRQVARVYARSRASIIFWGMGVSQSTHGTDNARCLIAMALLTGQVGRPGTGLHPLRGQNNVQGASDVGLIPMVYPDYKFVDSPETKAFYEVFWGTELDGQRGLTVVEIMHAARDGDIKAMYIMGENPAMSDPDLNHAREALASLDHLVVQDIFLTETAALADVVLPASAWPEKSGTVTNSNRQVQIGRPALPLPGEARRDLDIIIALARGLGLRWDYDGPADVFAEMGQAMPSLANITWDRLEREHAVTYPCPAPDQPGEAIVFGDGFPTADGRGRLVPALIVDPQERPDDAFPFVLTTGRQLEHWHTGAMTHHASLLEALEPVPVAMVSPGDRQRLGLDLGQEIRIATRRGTVTAHLRQDPNVPAGMVFMPFCYPGAAANLLTDPSLDPFGKIPGFKYCAARIEPANHTEQVAAE